MRPRCLFTVRRYVTPDEAAMERAYNLTARQWEAWMAEVYRPSYNVAPCG